MRLKKIARVVAVFLLLIGISGLSRPAGADTSVDHSIYDDLLKHYVKDGRVDYNGFKTDVIKLERYLKVLEKVDTAGLNREEQFAFYINAYNAWTIRLILTGYPGIDSIKDLGGLFQSPWKMKICRIDGKLLSLDEVEHDILRPRFKDPRVHFAINCASKGCPPLHPEPFTGRKLNQQLDAATTAFINNPEHNRIEGKTLYVSKLFKWFSEDFNEDITGFFRKYAKERLKTALDQLESPADIRYLNYDWSLNSQQRD